MLRGRHRGLPVAIDRAVMLPNEYKSEDATGENSMEPDPDYTEPSTAATTDTSSDYRLEQQQQQEKRDASVRSEKKRVSYASDRGQGGAGCRARCSVGEGYARTD